MIPKADQNPLLHVEMPTFDFDSPPVDPVELASDLIKEMREGRGVGLAANQTARRHRVFVMTGDPPFACFNPKITTYGEEEVYMEEGCLSYPGLAVKVKRPQSIRVRFQDPYGNTIVKKFTGMSSRIFQHELDHLDGIDFIKRANRIHKERAMRKWRKITKLTAK